MAAEGKESKMDDIEETVKEDAMRDRTYSASSVSGLSGDSHRGGDMAIDEMGSIDEILEDGKGILYALIYFMYLHICFTLFAQLLLHNSM